MATILLETDEEVEDIPIEKEPDSEEENGEIILEEKPEQLEGTPCYAVEKGHNNASYERINVVFVGFGMEQEDFISFLPFFVDYNGTGLTALIEEREKIETEEGVEVFTENKTITFRGILGVEPFKSNKDKFNFWYISEIQNITEPEIKQRSNFCKYYCISNISESCGLPNTYPIYICNTACSAYGSWVTNRAYIGKIYLEKDAGLNPYNIRLVVHEFGHSFGGLRDEYIQPERADLTGPPNCAPDLENAEEWWGDLVGQGEGELEVGYFYGCSYSEENIRPTNKSLMGISSSPFYDFGIVNERHLQNLLDLYSGEYSENIADIDPPPVGGDTGEKEELEKQ